MDAILAQDLGGVSIEHHGIKGQKWGVRKKKPLYSDTLSDKDYTVNSGNSIYRVSSKKNEVLGKKATYVTTNKHDRDEYAGNFAPLMDKAYEMKMSNINQLVSPSAKKRAKMYIDLYKNDPVFRRSFAGAVKKSTIPGALGFGGSKKTYMKRYGNLSDEKLNSKRVLRLMSTTMQNSRKVRDSIVNETKARGYNALIDDNDAGSYSKAPLIVINAKKDLKISSVKPLTDKQMFDAFQRSLNRTNKINKSRKAKAEYKSLGVRGG